MKRVVLILLSLTTALTLIHTSAYAHSEHQLDEWVEGWREDSLPGGVTHEEVEEFLAMMERHPGYAQYQSPSQPTQIPSREPSSNSGRSTKSSWSGGVEQWRPLIAAYFPADQLNMALCVVTYESGGNPRAKNPRSSARGLFQVLASLWAPHYGVSYEDLYDPETNTRIAADIWRNYGWGAWSAARKC